MTAAVVIECDFNTEDWWPIGNVYTCDLHSDPSITSPGITVTSANGNHEPLMSHADVQAFCSYGNTINFIPRGLNEVFPKLIAIWISNAGIKELHQSDLKQFPRLRFFSLYINAITVVEQDLFKFNPELEYIELGHNEITQIHPTVFDHLSKLRYLCLESNVCINAYAENRSTVVNLISRVKQECLGDFNIVEEELRPVLIEAT
jgi:hypothetical protein